MNRKQRGEFLWSSFWVVLALMLGCFGLGALYANELLFDITIILLYVELFIVIIGSLNQFMRND